MISSLYESTVTHTRFTPRRHRFTYRLFSFCLDPDEIDALAARIPWLSRNRFNLFSYYDRDHVGVREWLAARGYGDVARLLLLTNLRVAGYVFNPVSFWFAFDADDRPIVAVAEVNNTFGETKLYPVALEEDGRFVADHPKHFYISPFAPLDTTLRIRLLLPAERLGFAIETMDGETCLVRATMTGRRVPLTAGRLLWYALKYPLVTVKVIAAIHWEALRLWLRRVPFHRKSERPDLQTAIVRPARFHS